MTYDKEKWKVYYENRKKILATSEGKKSQVISSWKRKGLIDNYDKVYVKYLNTNNCEKCNISFDKVKKCMDHNHTDGKFRNVLCNRCNSSMPDKKIQSNNKLGHKNISFYRNIYNYDKRHNGKRYRETNENLQVLLWYKFVIHMKLYKSF